MSVFTLLKHHTNWGYSLKFCYFQATFFNFLNLWLPYYVDIIEAKKVYIQLSFEIYKGKLVLRFKSLSVYVYVLS